MGEIEKNIECSFLTANTAPSPKHILVKGGTQLRSDRKGNAVVESPSHPTRAV